MSFKVDHELAENSILPSSGPAPLPEAKDYPSHIRFRPPPLILTPRLLLRYATEDDIPAIHTFLVQKETMKYMLSNVSLSLEDSERWYRSRFVKDPITGAGGGEFCYLICLRDGDTEGEPIGTTGSRRAPNLGYQIGAGPKYWGKGYGSEAVGAAVKGICETIRAEQQKDWEKAYVSIRMDQNNIGSVKVAEKVGAKRYESRIEEDGKLEFEYRYYVKDWIA